MNPLSGKAAGVTLILGLLVLQAAGTGCFARKENAPQTVPQPPPEPAPSSAEPQPDPRVPELEAEIRGLERSILEKESEVQELRQRLDYQQRMLDDAIQEVVRAKAKLRSLESRAEAASQMAETEIAYKALKDKAGEAGPSEVFQIDQMMTQSAAEFENENFGGALYLSSQAKALIQNVQIKLSAMVEVPSGTGEVSFSVPLTLQVIKRSNVRSEPGLDASVLVTLDPGSTVTGYSHKGDWVRVKLEDGTRGWIHQSLLSGA